MQEKITYFSLPTGKLHKKTEVKKSKNLPSNFKTEFYKKWPDNVDSSFDSNFQKKSCLKSRMRMSRIPFSLLVNLVNICRRISTCILHEIG